MGKQNPKAAKLLYRKSNCTLNTRSKTCSGASQFLTKSGVIQLKKKLPKTSYYIDNGKIKRDLSIATDICILRGYYKKKIGRFKHSMNATEVETIDEFDGDKSACGDSIFKENHDKTRLNIDVTSLVVENLKDLLNDWIKKYLLDNNETKQKIQTVLDSILHKIERQKNSSYCTYTLDIKVGEEKHSDSNVAIKRANKQIKQTKQSCQTVPVSGKHMRLISTLSIPRNIKRQINYNKSQSSKQTTRKVRYKNVFLTVSRSSTFLLNTSSFNLLSISTKSFTRRCATYQSPENNNGKKQDVALLPKSSYSETLSDTIYQEDTKLGFKNTAYPNVVEPMQSLVKSIFADDPANVTSTEKNLYKCKNDNYTMTDIDGALKNLTSRTQCHKLHWRKETMCDEVQVAENRNKKKKVESTRKKQRYSKLKTVSYRRNIRKPKPMRIIQSLKCFNKSVKRSSNLYRKANLCRKENNLLKDLQKILNSFAHYTDSKTIKFDIHINVTPMSTDIADTDADKAINNSNLTTAYNIITKRAIPETIDSDKNQKESKSDSCSESAPKLISLLDGAISQSKYVIGKEASSEITNKIKRVENIRESNYISPGSEIAKDIRELRVIIKDLAATTENFVKEHLDHIKSNEPYDEKVIHKKKSNKTNSIEDGVKTSMENKAIQITNGQAKSHIVSGLKLKKGPKRKEVQEIDPRLTKNSVSYNIIESESILKVTDMTSAATEINKEKLTDKALNCSLPKSKSQFEITGNNKKKLLAYYCDELIKSRQYIQNRNLRSSDNGRYTTCPHIENESCRLINDNKCMRGNEKQDEVIICIEPKQHVPYDEDCGMCDPGYSCSSVYIGLDDRCKKFTVRSRGGVGFWEGLIYCILLWIPVVIILWLIYVYVIKDMIQLTNPAIGRKLLPARHLKNSSFFHITLSDLGF